MAAGSKKPKNDVVRLLGNDLSAQRQILQHECLSHGAVTTVSVKGNFSPFFHYYWSFKTYQRLFFSFTRK